MGGIKLLTKQEIAKAQSLDRSKEIAEGLKISRKVDSLRELMAHEEQVLAKFRDESILAINKEVSEVTDVKNSLLAEVIALRIEKTKGLKEVEVANKDLVAYKRFLDERDGELAEKHKTLDEKEEEVTLNLQNSNDELERSRSHTEEGKRLHEKAFAEREEAVITLIEAKDVKANVLTFKKETEKSLSSREKLVNQRETSALAMEEANKEMRTELDNEKIKLSDQRKTLERALERLQKNG